MLLFIIDLFLKNEIETCWIWITIVKYETVFPDTFQSDFLLVYPNLNGCCYSIARSDSIPNPFSRPSSSPEVILPQQLPFLTTLLPIWIYLGSSGRIKCILYEYIGKRKLDVGGVQFLFFNVWKVQFMSRSTFQVRPVFVLSSEYDDIHLLLLLHYLHV